MMYPKVPRARNQRLLDLATGKPCLVQAVRCTGQETTVAAHSNQLRHGKGKGTKAHDYYSVWCCAACHHWLDGSYSATKEEKFEAWNQAHARQVKEWEKLDDPAARWALAQLGLMPA